MRETHCLIIVDIYGKFFENPSKHKKVMARTRKSGETHYLSHRHRTAILATSNFGDYVELTAIELDKGHLL